MNYHSRYLFFVCFLGFGALALSGQAREDLRIPGELIVHFAEEVAVPAQLASWSRSRSAAAVTLRAVRPLGIRHNLYLLRFDEARYPVAELLQWLRRQPVVRTAQANYTVEFRNTPNDTEYFRQWDMDLIGAPEAWAHTTGGQTPNGTPIVVAIMDSGFDLQHEDLQDNLWHNPAEIPGDGIDNDNNGYVDDDLGWNYYNDNPAIAPGNHGLSTSAIVGARGNNGLGVTGVNWQTQMMLFTFSSVADLVRAYEYVIDQRARFNESLGATGAFVVATNNSFGQERVRCAQQPVWASMYDLLGEVGILSSAGVGNSRYDADAAGDVPGTCPSDYLVVSCNTDADDNLYTNSAYGAVSVDLGSPGEGSFTAKPQNTYGTFGGNSAATPHVTGAIALLYSAPCADFLAQALAQPAATARFVKQLLLDGTEKVPSLTFRTVTGGRLHVGASMTSLLATCTNTLGDLQVLTLRPNPTSAALRVDFRTPGNGTYLAQLYNALGQQVLQQSVPVDERGARSFVLELGHLPAGVYFLRFGTGKEWVTERVVVY